jgi:hypothetical protein
LFVKRSTIFFEMETIYCALCRARKQATAKVALKWSLSRDGRRREPRLTSDYDESE